MEPKQTKIEGTIKVGDKEFSKGYYDDIDYNLYPHLTTLKRFEKIRDFTTGLERTIAIELGLSLEEYIEWRERR